MATVPVQGYDMTATIQLKIIVISIINHPRFNLSNINEHFKQHKVHITPVKSV